MNQYGQRMLEHCQRFRPTEFARIEHPTTFFTEAGEQVQADVTELRDQILAGLRPWETLEDFRQRSYQALREAEEIVLADHLLLQPDPDLDPEPENLAMSEDDPELAAYYQRLALIDQALNPAS